MQVLDATRDVTEKDLVTLTYRKLQDAHSGRGKGEQVSKHRSLQSTINPCERMSFIEWYNFILGS